MKSVGDFFLDFLKEGFLDGAIDAIEDLAKENARKLLYKVRDALYDWVDNL